MADKLFKDDDGVCPIAISEDIDRIMIRRDGKICYVSATELKTDIEYKVDVKDKDVLLFLSKKNQINEYSVMALPTSKKGDFKLQKNA